MLFTTILSNVLYATKKIINIIEILLICLIKFIVQSINDVICGVIFLGTRLYMKAMKAEKVNANTTALVLLNTRNIAGYKTVKEMFEQNPNSKWGNQFGFLHVSVPILSKNFSPSKPLGFVYRAKEIIQRKRNSAAVFLTGKLLDTIRRHRGPEVRKSIYIL